MNARKKCSTNSVYFKYICRTCTVLWAFNASLVKKNQELKTKLNEIKALLAVIECSGKDNQYKKQ